MCGLTFSYLTNTINKDTRVLPSEILDKVTELEKNFNIIKLDNLFKICQLYKSDFNFLYFYNDVNERNEISKLIKKIEELNNKRKNEFLKNNLDNLKIENKLLDIIWFLDDELKVRYNFIKSFLFKEKLSDLSVTLLKTLNTILNANNLLEMRGRDSLGLYLNIILKNNCNNLDWVKTNNFKTNNFLKVNKNNISFSLVYKYHNVYGALGDNSENILEQIKSDKLFKNLLIFGNFKNINIFAHTRWASVGKINHNNTHPLINLNHISKSIPTVFTSMNGDINNYEEIIKKNVVKSKYLNKNINSDTLAVSYLFSKLDNFRKNKLIFDLFNFLEGSFATFITSDLDFSKIVIAKKENQGLYFGKSEDRYFFSSDVYGIVEECNNYFEFPKNSYFVLNTKKIPKEITPISLHNKKRIKKLLLHDTKITSRDISKKAFSYYLEKEIYESKDIVEKTIYNYFNKNLSKEKNSNFLNFNKYKYLNKTIKLIKKNQIKKIYITGMGTCYTAAECIVSLLSKKFQNKKYNIEIAAVLASEASAFYLKDNMADTLIIAIAQSGTTKDTNTFIQMAKNRGSKTIAILNKRNGDISHLVGETLYIGDGRDIEIAVPSTKTYVAHVTVGYLLSLYLQTKIFGVTNKIKEQKNLILRLPKLIQKTVVDFEKIDLNKIYSWFLNKKNWYVVYDDTSKKYASLETRIKLSECCYHSLPQLNINYIDHKKTTNSLFIYNIGIFDNFNIEMIKKLSKKNKIILLGKYSKLKIFFKQKNIFIIPHSDNFNQLSVLPNVINGQLLSFSVAKALDKRTKVFEQLLKSYLDNKNKKINEFCNSNIENSIFANYPIDTILKLKKIIVKKDNLSKKNTLNLINYLILHSKRPIDTIKHQAKTITVGTDRIGSAGTKKLPQQLKKIKYRGINRISFLDYFNIDQVTLVHNSKNIFSEIFNEYLSYYKNLNIIDPIISLKDRFYKSNNKNELIINIMDSGYDDDTFVIKLKVNNKFEIIDIFSYENLLPNEYNEYIIKLNKLFIFINNIIYTLCDKQNLDYILNIFSQFEYQKEQLLRFNKNNLNNKKIDNLIKKIKSNSNLKIIGGSSNYTYAKFLSSLISRKLNRAIAYDTIENHKHIDISSESTLIILLSNITNKSYIDDAYSEIEKFIAHNNSSFLIENKCNNNLTKLRKVDILYTPQVIKEIGIFNYLKTFEKLYYNT